MKCIFIYNPNSGKGNLIERLPYIETQLKTKYEEVRMYPTSSQEDTIEISKKACLLYDAIIFSGGDGTFNDIANSVASSDVRPPLGYIPSGTANDIARNLKIPRNLNGALKVILKGKSISHDAGLINNKYFVYVAGCGSFTSISYRTNQRIKRALGRVAYVLDGVKEIAKPTIVNAKIKVNDKIIEQECPLLLVLNSRSVGGVPFNKRGHLNDGFFDVIICKKFGTYLGSILRLLLIGTFKGRDHTKYYDFYRGNEMEITVQDNITWTIDGEEGPTGSVHIKNLRNRLQIFVPIKHNKPKSKHLLANKNE